MREIKFRARIKSTYEPNLPFKIGDWVYGYYVDFSDVTKIFTEINDEMFAAIVDPETVGEYTGLKDKNGKEIYEGDIVEWKGNWGKIRICKQSSIGKIIWENSGFGIETIREGYEINPKYPRTINRFRLEFYSDMGEDFLWDELKIIGNIYENPELLKENNAGD